MDLSGLRTRQPLLQQLHKTVNPSWSQYGASPSDDKSAPGEAQFNNKSSAVNQSDQPPLLLQKE